MNIYRLTDTMSREDRQSSRIIQLLVELGFGELNYHNELWNIDQCLFDNILILDGNELTFRYNGRWYKFNFITCTFHKANSKRISGARRNDLEVAILSRLLEAMLNVNTSKTQKFTSDQLVQGLKLMKIDLSDVRFTVNYVTHGLEIYLKDAGTEARISVEDLLNIILYRQSDVSFISELNLEGSDENLSFW